MIKVHEIRLRSGERVSISERDDGVVCPVCGFVHGGDLPYAWTQGTDATGQPVDGQFGSPSFDTCPSCRTEYGVDDYAEDRSVKDMWKGLRIDWLDRMHWSEAALTQLWENLKIDEDQVRREAEHRKAQ